MNGFKVKNIITQNKNGREAMMNRLGVAGTFHEPIISW